MLTNDEAKEAEKKLKAEAGDTPSARQIRELRNDQRRKHPRPRFVEDDFERIVDMAQGDE